MEKTKPKHLISIIMPNYNGEKYIEKAIDSFILQKYDNKELIIVDNKSTDNSHAIINKYLKYDNIKWIRDTDNGISNAYNIGLNYVQGDIIGYLGSDDLLTDGIFKKINNLFAWSNFDAVYFNSYTFYVNVKNCILRKVPEINFNHQSLFSYGTIVGLQNIFFKAELIKELKLDESNKMSMDYELYFRICEKKNKLILYSDEIATINIFDDNISNSLSEPQRNEMILVAKKYALKYGYKGKLFFENKKIGLMCKIKKKIKNLLKKLFS